MRRVGALAAACVAIGGGVLYATPAVPCACSTPGYAAPFSTGAPVVSGATVVGSVLTTTNGSWANDTSGGFTYQWYDTNGTIGGATSSTYTIGAGEVGLLIHMVVTATGVGGSKSATSNSVGPISSVSGLSANEWLSPTGSDSGSACVHNGSPVAAPTAANACATPQKACSLASASDVIGVIGGTYTVGFILTACSNVTFQTTPHAFVSFAPISTIAGTTNVTLQGDDIGHGVGFSLASTTISSTNTNLVWDDVNLYCAVVSPYIIVTQSSGTGETACNSSVSINAAGGFTWNGGDQEQSAVCLALCTHTGGGINPNDDLISPLATGILIENIIQKNIWGMDPTGLSPSLHHEIWFLDGGTGLTFKNDQIYDCGPTVASGYPVNSSCNTAAIFVGFFGSENTSDNVALIQDIIAPTSSVNSATHKAFQWGHEKPLGHEYTFTDYYSSLDGGFSLCGVSSSKCDGSTITGSGITFVGAVTQRGFGACFASETDTHTVIYFATGSAVNCGAGPNTIYNSTANTSLWSSPGPSSYNYSPLADLQTKGENTVCATLPNAQDIFGNARPTMTACDAGAVQH